METTVKQPAVNSEELELKVKDMYKAVAEHPEETYHFEMGRSLAERLGYPSAVLDTIPSEAIDSFAGVGYFFDLAQLTEGEKVVDLGSGAGTDVFFAAQKVGKQGEVIGIDMTKEQLEKSSLLRTAANFTQVGFQQAYIENLPLEDASMDVVISNGVINLSIQKATVFQEAARVLKPGGRLVLADIVTTDELPPSISDDVSLWASCIGGAMEAHAYQELITSAGFELSQIKTNPL